MRDDYKFKSSTVKVQIEVEKEVAEKLQQMEKYTKLSQGEIANTALKRFMSAHQDFLPPKQHHG